MRTNCRPLRGDVLTVAASGMRGSRVMRCTSTLDEPAAADLARCHTGRMDRPQTIDEYLEGFTGQGRELLEQVRALAHDGVPEATEAVKWGHPAWVHPSGTILFVVSGHAKHANFTFTPSTREAFEAELVGFATGKGSVKLPYGQPLPYDLLRRMIAFRLREHEDHGVLWM
jgi:uncharacterized protein YdhG (YjbR/CyaY superfamily)